MTLKTRLGRAGIVAATSAALIAGPVLATPAINASAPAQSTGIEIPVEGANAAWSTERWLESCGIDTVRQGLWWGKYTHFEKRRAMVHGGYRGKCIRTGYTQVTDGPAKPWFPKYNSAGHRIGSYRG